MKIMSIGRLRPVALALLILAGGGAAGAFAFAQRPNGPDGREQPKAAGAPAPRLDRRLVEDRIQTARAILKDEVARVHLMIGRGGVTLEEIVAWSRRLMDDRLRLAATPGERRWFRTRPTLR